MKPLITLTLALLLAAHSVFGANKSKLSFKRIQENPQQVEFAVRSSSNEAVKAVALSHDASLETETSELPIHLTLLVDTSQAAELQGSEEISSGLIQRIKKQLNKSSLVTVVGYNQESVTVHAERVPVRALTKIGMEFDPGAVSSSLDRPLALALKAHSTKGLTSTIWVVSSGNIRISKGTLAKLKKAGLPIHLALTNARLEKSLRPIAKRYGAVLGSDKVALSVIEKKSKNLLEYWSRISVLPAPSLMGKAVKIALQSSESQSKAISVKFPQLGLSYWIQFFARRTLSILGILFGIYCLYRLIRWYMPRQCKGCQKRLFPASANCTACQLETEAYLVGPFNLGALRKWGQKSAVSLNRKICELGTHKRSLVPLFVPRNRRHRCYAEIHHLDGDRYQLIPKMIHREAVFLVNGNRVAGPQFLKVGDDIQVEHLHMKFWKRKGSSCA